ncbi:MAG: 3-oxoacyl-[acyl-carrier-protein] reductase [Alphaproteobacteria bacterium]|nr:3-oxoacyl-[acyl-carrier-protein] reductase [Alphaproteobacteria bacterium]MBO4643700.1 3-oxoacyl-[acyl-carrier-protein] reductase [Alphaproteobacteria bacterium]
MDFTGKCALVTGATGGIGRVIVKKLHDAGATVILTDMRQEALDEFAAELKERVFAFACNLGDPADIDELVAKAEKAAGAIDILVNNAGLTKDNLFMRMKDEDWNLVLNVNLTAGFRLARATIRGMMKRRYGRIVSMASIVGVTGNPGQANYSASKAGMIAMTKCLAAEVASRGITANCVAPGFIKTAMTDALPEEAKEKLAKTIPMARLGLPEDVANAVVFLASDEASYITGQTIHVNGGMAMI